MRLDANSPTKPGLREKRDRLGHPRYNSRSTEPMFNELNCVILTKPLLEGDVPVGCAGVILMVYTEPCRL